jgi:hypothetical protein
MAIDPRDTRSADDVLVRPGITTRASRAVADQQAVAILRLEGLVPDAVSDTEMTAWREGLSNPMSQAVASVRAEGLEPNADEMELIRLIDAGEITSEEAIRLYRGHLEQHDFVALDIPIKKHYEPHHLPGAAKNSPTPAIHRTTGLLG